MRFARLAGKLGVAAALALELRGRACGDARANRALALAVGAAASASGATAGHLDLQVDAVEQRPGDRAPIARDLRRACSGTRRWSCPR